MSDKIKWTSERMAVVSECVVDFLLRENDVTLLTQLDGFSPALEKREEKFYRLVDEILTKLQLHDTKRSAIHAQLSTIGCAYKSNRNYNRKKGIAYQKLIDELLVENSCFDKNEVSEEHLNAQHEYMEGKLTPSVTRQRNQAVRNIILERDNYTCQCCYLTPMERFKHTLHVHHIQPLHLTKTPKKVHLDELITLCPTCHSYVHSQIEPLTIQEVQNIVSNHVE